MLPPTRKSTSSAKTQSFFVDRLFNLPSRLGLTKNAQTLLKALDEVKQGMIEEVDLGRKIRLSSVLRRTIPDTITQCTETMTRSPSEASNCIQMIQKCTEILKITDRIPPKRQFPFLKLPLEIRTRIYDLCFGRRGVICRQSFNTENEPSCPSGFCPVQEDVHPVHLGRYVDISIALTCKRIKDEALPVLYAYRTLAFGCVCRMDECLESNEILRENACKIRFHWRGSSADVAIGRLMSCPELRNLCIRISRMTTYQVTERETRMRQYFRAQRTNPRLSDANGIEQLLEIRGLDTVDVEHAPGRVSSKRTDEDKWSLQLLLDSKLLLEKPAVSIKPSSSVVTANPGIRTMDDGDDGIHESLMVPERFDFEEMVSALLLSIGTYVPAGFGFAHLGDDL